jgi:cell division protein FtsB
MLLQRISWPWFIVSLLMLYACVQYMTGEKGYFSQTNRKHDIAELSIQLTKLKIEREELSARARYLSSDSLSDDLLEERARVLLGLGNPHIYVLHDPQLKIQIKGDLGSKTSEKALPNKVKDQPMA